MNILLLLIIIFIIIILFNCKNTEKMTDVVPYSNEEELIPEPNTSCCLVEKKYLPNDNSLYRGDFKYMYSPKKNEMCNPSLYDLNNNQQLLIDGVNNWSNKNCNDQNTFLGSCRNINNECIDFVDQQFCNQISGMVWSGKTCQNPLEYVWQDRIIRSVPEKDKNDGSFIMFPEKQKLY